MSFNSSLGPRVALASGFQVRNGVRFSSGSGFPKSGTSGTGIDRNGVGMPFGSIYVDTASGVAFVNEGTTASPYWFPINFHQRGLMGWYTDFRDGAGKAVSDTAATATLVGSGIRVHGQGVAETDSGLTVAMSSDGAVGSMVTTDEVAHLLALSVGTGTTAMLKPSVNGTMVIDANITNSSAITLRANFIGFATSAADAIDPLMTFSGTTISFAATQADDVCGLVRSVDLTATGRWFAPHDKANANASIATTATGVDTGVDIAAAATYQRLRVEVDADGGVRMFIDKAQVASFAAATMTTTTALQPILYVESTSTATKTLLVKHFAAYGKRA